MSNLIRLFTFLTSLHNFGFFYKFTVHKVDQYIVITFRYYIHRFVGIVYLFMQSYTILLKVNTP